MHWESGINNPASLLKCHFLANSKLMNKISESLYTVHVKQINVGTAKNTQHIIWRDWGVLYECMRELWADLSRTCFLFSNTGVKWTCWEFGAP